MKTKLIIISFMILLLQSEISNAQPTTEGSVEFTVTTRATGEGYSPQHVLAIWVTDTTGNFIKTLKVQGLRMKIFLNTWMNGSQFNDVDALTTATLGKHLVHTVTWDCSDTTGTVVADGDYQIHVEFTELNGQGPVTPVDYIQFTKGEKPFSFKPEDLTYFYNMELYYTPLSRLSK